MPETAPVSVAHDARTTTITLDDPQRANRITVRAMGQLMDGLRQAHDAGSRILVLRASGDDFTLGRDQSERPVGITRQESLRTILEANDLLGSFPGVSVCLVQGRALGFGSGLALQSDITLAADDATLGFDEVLHGLAPLVVAEYLPRYVGAKVAAELVLTGRAVPAHEALALRMVNRLVPPGELATAGEALVDHLCGLEPGALRLMKRFALELGAGALADAREEAIVRLDAWIDAGRPQTIDG